MEASFVPAPADFSTFGELLKFLRRRRKLTQLELALAVGYSESQISHLEQNHRAPDNAVIAARFIPALGLEQEARWSARLLELALSPASLELGSLTRPALAGMHNLRVNLTSFVGRQQQLDEVVQALAGSAKKESRSRLVTLTGVGGSGKTRLALQAAFLLRGEFPQGVWWVDLGALSKPSLVPQTVATVFGIKDQSSRPMIRTLIEFLGSANLLLILDNCEHLVLACAAFVEAILVECPRLKILTTTREILNIPGETAISVPPLLTPALHTLPSLDRIPRYDAVQLFAERAAVVSPGFTLTAENAAQVVQICQRLEGIPLAIELAAARLRMLSVQQIAQGLDDRFALLTGGRRTAPARHQTLQALVDWSYELLPEPERVHLCQLSVFAGGWTLEAAKAIARTQEATDRVVIELLGHLIDKSLVMVEQRQSAVRYRMLDTIRQYAQEKLAAGRHRTALQRAHALYFLGLAEGGRTVDAWFDPDTLTHDQVEDEHENIRAALMWCQSPSGDPQLGIELAAAMLRFWFERGYWSEWRGWVEGALAQAANLPPSAALARCYFGLGTILAFQSEFETSRAQFEASLQLYQQLQDVPWILYVTYRLGWVAREQGDGETARRLMESSLEQFRALEDTARVAEVLVTVGEVAVLQEDAVKAQEFLEEGIAMSAPLKENRANLPWGLNHLGHVAQLNGDYERAYELHLASLNLFSELGVQHSGMAWSRHGLGETALGLGDAVGARSHLHQALITYRDLGDRMGIAWCLEGFSALAALENQPERAAQLYGASEALRQSIGARHAPAVRVTHASLLESTRTLLGQPHFEEWFKRGSRMPLHDAVTLALENSVQAGAPPT